MANEQQISQVVPVSGLKLGGKAGISSSGAKDWFTVTNGQHFSFANLLAGSVVSDCNLEIQACLIGGESAPDTLYSWDPTTVIVLETESNKAYDKLRVNVLDYLAPGLGSNILLSVR